MKQFRSDQLEYSRLPFQGMDAPHRVLIMASLIMISNGFSSCGFRGDRGSTSTAMASILLFNGTGTSPSDVAALETVLNDNHLNYSTVNSSHLNQMAESQVRRYRLLIVPGGNFVEIGNGLTPQTTGNVRDAVESGLNYLGICGGAFFAGNSPYNGLNLTSGVRFRFYSAEDRGIRKAAVAIVSDGAPTLDQYWEDGPQFMGWGAVVGKYPDGTPAVVEGALGSGWVILAGVQRRLPAGGAG